jgi:molecular chaperone GrpE
MYDDKKKRRPKKEQQRACERARNQGSASQKFESDTPAAEEDIVEVVDNEIELETRIAELTAGLAAANDKYLRLSAEFDNFRKRTLKEKMDLMKNASESVIVNLLPVIDDFERAMNAIENSDNLETTKEGIKLIYNKFKDFTKQNGVVEMEAKGLVLDTDHHEAITKIPAPSEELKGKIVEVVQKGYILNDKVIRYAKVVIGE